MAHQLEFERVVNYDHGQPGITLHAQLKLKEQAVGLDCRAGLG